MYPCIHEIQMYTNFRSLRPDLKVSNGIGWGRQWTDFGLVLSTVHVSSIFVNAYLRYRSLKNFTINFNAEVLCLLPWPQGTRDKRVGTREWSLQWTNFQTDIYYLTSDQLDIQTWDTDLKDFNQNILPVNKCSKSSMLILRPLFCMRV